MSGAWRGGNGGNGGDGYDAALIPSCCPVPLAVMAVTAVTRRRTATVVAGGAYGGGAIGAGTSGVGGVAVVMVVPMVAG